MQSSRVKVLDHGYVELVEAWGADERIIEAARMSTGKGFQGWMKCPDCGTVLSEPQRHTSAPGVFCPNVNVLVEADLKLLAYLYRHKHMTPFEMCGATFEVMAPIFVYREWHRHRTQSYNEMSARYIPLPDVDYVPDVEDLVKRSGAAANSKNRQASGGGAVLDHAAAQEWQDKLRMAYHMAQKVYEEGLLRGVPKELARLPVTVGRYSRMRASANLRNWMQFLELRLAPTAQQEIRLYGQAVQSLLTEKFPRTMDLFTTSRRDEMHAKAGLS